MNAVLGNSKDYSLKQYLELAKKLQEKAEVGLLDSILFALVFNFLIK